MTKTDRTQAPNEAYPPERYFGQAGSIIMRAYQSMADPIGFGQFERWCQPLQEAAYKGRAAKPLNKEGVTGTPLRNDPLVPNSRKPFNRLSVSEWRKIKRWLPELPLSEAGLDFRMLTLNIHGPEWQATLTVLYEKRTDTLIHHCTGHGTSNPFTAEQVLYVIGRGIETVKGKLQTTDAKPGLIITLRLAFPDATIEQAEAYREALTQLEENHDQAQWEIWWRQHIGNQIPAKDCRPERVAISTIPPIQVPYKDLRTFHNVLARMARDYVPIPFSAQTRRAYPGTWVSLTDPKANNIKTGDWAEKARQAKIAAQQQTSPPVGSLDPA